jgi:hypothetical protein
MPTLAEVLRQTGYAQDGTITPQPVNSPMTKALSEHIKGLPQQFAANQAEQMALLGKAFPGNTYESMMTQGDPKAMAELAMQVPIVGMTKAALPRKELIEQQLSALEDTGRAKAGGQVADANGFFYKGGQFLPTTTAEPGKWRVGKKWITSGSELIEPGTRANQPTPFSRGILGMVMHYTDLDKSGQMTIKQGPKIMQVKDGFQEYVPVSVESEFTPGVKGVLNKEPITLGELVNAYNKGQRWFDVQPDAVTLTTKK